IITHTALFSRSCGIPLSGIARISFRTMYEFFRRSSSLSCANAPRVAESRTKARILIFIFDPFGLQISSRCRARLKQRGNFRMVALRGKGQRGFSVVGRGMRIGSVRQKKLRDIQAAVRGSRKQRRIARGIAVIGVRALLQKPLNDGGVAAGDRASKGVVTGAIGGGRADVRAVSSEILDDFQMPEKSRKGHNWKSVGGKRVGLGDIFFNQLPDTREHSHGSGFR